MQQAKSGPMAPWWRHGIVWMVWGGPALVVVASFVTLALVIRHPDPALNTAEPDMRRAPAEDDSGAHQPAMPARNHAAEKH